MLELTRNTSIEMDENKQCQIQYSLGMVVLYVALAFAITWIILIPALSTLSGNLLTLAFISAAFGPFLSAVITIWVGRGRAELWRWLRQIFTLRIPAILYLTGALFLPIGVGALHYGLYSILGGQPDFSTAMPWYTYLIALILTALLTGATRNLAGAALRCPLYLIDSIL